MQKIIFILKIVVIVAYCCSCSPGKAITGVLTDCNGQEVSCKGYRFKVSGTAPKCGSLHSFTPTLNRRKLNCKLIK